MRKTRKPRRSTSGTTSLLHPAIRTIYSVCSKTFAPRSKLPKALRAALPTPDLLLAYSLDQFKHPPVFQNQWNQDVHVRQDQNIVRQQESASHCIVRDQGRP